MLYRGDSAKIKVALAAGIPIPVASMNAYLAMMGAMFMGQAKIRHSRETSRALRPVRMILIKYPL